MLDHVDDAVETGNHGSHAATIGDYRVVIVCMLGMGNVNAAASTRSGDRGLGSVARDPDGHRRGREGVRDADVRGDVVVAEQVVSYELRQGPARGYRAAIRGVPEAKRSSTAPRCSIALAGRCPSGPTGLMIQLADRAACASWGGGASGEKVIADDATVPRLRADWARLIAVEMEGVGAALAAYASDSVPGFLLVKAFSHWRIRRRTIAGGTTPPARPPPSSGAAHDASVSPAQQPRSIRRLASKQPPRPVFEATVIRRLTDDWIDVADYFEISPAVRATFGLRGRTAAHLGLLGAAEEAGSSRGRHFWFIERMTSRMNSRRAAIPRPIRSRARPLALSSVRRIGVCPRGRRLVGRLATPRTMSWLARGREGVRGEHPTLRVEPSRRLLDDHVVISARGFNWRGGRPEARGRRLSRAAPATASSGSSSPGPSYLSRLGERADTIVSELRTALAAVSPTTPDPKLPVRCTDQMASRMAPVALGPE